MQMTTMSSSDIDQPSLNMIVDDCKKFFGVREMPFTLVPNTQYYLALPSHDECSNMLLFAITSGEGFIKVTGEVGTGKTLLCRRLLNSLDNENYCTAYLPNPRLTSVELKRAIAKELDVQFLSDIDDRDLLEVINMRLVDLANEQKKVVLIIDEAQALPKDTIEELRLLSNLETETSKLIQIVLFGQPELDTILSTHHFRQLRQRITFSHRLEPLNKKSVAYYVQHRMIVAGYNGEPAFESSAINMLFKATKGTPRLINVICGKAMIIAFSLGLKKITKSMIKSAIKDTEGVELNNSWLAWS